MLSENNQKPSLLYQIEQKYRKLPQELNYVKEAVAFLEQILSQYPDSTFISFNGGKDATIVLVLTYLALKQLSLKDCLSNSFSDTKNDSIKMPEGMYFEESDPFPEMIQFLNEMVSSFGIKMHVLSSKKYADELKTFTQSRRVDCVIMGNRKDDPGCSHLKPISPTDTHKGYPDFKRILPIIRWEYDQVWPAINALGIPFCKLYNEGYSSLGNRKNTVKNPTLIAENNTYKPPSEAKAQTERVCRITDNK